MSTEADIAILHALCERDGCHVPWRIEMSIRSLSDLIIHGNKTLELDHYDQVINESSMLMHVWYMMHKDDIWNPDNSPNLLEKL